jgi:hypothetical protein
MKTETKSTYTAREPGYPVVSENYAGPADDEIVLVRKDPSSGLDYSTLNIAFVPVQSARRFDTLPADARTMAINTLGIEVGRGIAKLPSIPRQTETARVPKPQGPTTADMT